MVDSVRMATLRNWEPNTLFSPSGSGMINCCRGKALICICYDLKLTTHGILVFSSGLDFTLQSLERSEANATEELSVSFTKGYEGTLRPHHGMLVRPIFAVRFLLFQDNNTSIFGLCLVMKIS